MEQQEITGCCTYKGVLAMQRPEVFEVFKEFITAVRPSRAVEIGTAGGGLTLCIRDIFNEIGLQDAPVRTFDVNPDQWREKALENKNIELHLENIFGPCDEEPINMVLSLTKPELIVPFIQAPGITLVLCDGGNKRGEFNCLARYLKPGDIIMAHDYINNKNEFQDHYLNKIWNWLEICDIDIQRHTEKYNLKPFWQDKFDKVVWVCKQKQ